MKDGRDYNNWKAWERAYRVKNRNRINEKKNSWYHRNKEKILAQQKAHREANKEEILKKEARRRAKRSPEKRAKDSAYLQAYYRKNRQRLKVQQRCYYEEHKADILAKTKSRAKKNPDVGRKSRKDRYWKNVKATRTSAKLARDKNKAAIKIYTGRYYQKNRACVLARGAAYRKTEKGKAARRTAERRRWVENANFNVASRLRARIRATLKEHGTYKKSRTETLIGCTIPALLLHLESLFQPGMSWANRSAWHIDHKRPCASYDLTDPTQQLQCFHYTNLQPLWKADNLAKGKKFHEAIAA